MQAYKTATIYVKRQHEDMWSRIMQTLKGSLSERVSELASKGLKYEALVQSGRIREE